MSDSWSVCRACGCFDAGFKQVDQKIDENNDEQLVECEECGAQIKQKEILWKHVEYGVDD